MGLPLTQDTRGRVVILIFLRKYGEDGEVRVKERVVALDPKYHKVRRTTRRGASRVALILS